MPLSKPGGELCRSDLVQVLFGWANPVSGRHCFHDVMDGRSKLIVGYGDHKMVVPLRALLA